MAKEFGSLILPDFAWAHWLRVVGREHDLGGGGNDGTRVRNQSRLRACLPDIHIDQQQSQQRVQQEVWRTERRGQL